MHIKEEQKLRTLRASKSYALSEEARAMHELKGTTVFLIQRSLLETPVPLPS